MSYLSINQGLSASLAVLALAVLLYKFLLSTSSRLKTSHNLPPGPKPKPIVGNITDLPPNGTKDWLHWKKQSDLYGPISSLTVLGQPIIIISDYNIASELLDKNSGFTSSRPTMTFGGEMCGWENMLAMIPYSAQFRAYRKTIHSTVGTSSAVDEFRPLFELEVRRFLVRLLDNPDNLVQLIRTQAGSIILEMSYGYHIERTARDPLVDLADNALAQFSAACVPGAFLVDTFPFLKYIPDWIPGTSFKRTARHWKATVTATVDKPYAFVQRQMQAGTAQPSYLSKLLQSPLSPSADHIARWSAASLYTGGADTTVSSLSCFFLAILLYPSVQDDAFTEISSVIGTHRLPTLSDRQSLPYIDALVKEVLRWHPVAPMGLPHRTTKAHVYKDYLIPVGSYLMAGIWAMFHDPTVYRDPDTFSPSRFLGDNPEPDPHDIAFGFGRRGCPGKILADKTLWLSIACTLAVFEIRKPVDEKGEEVKPIVDFLPGVISHPGKYRCDVVPRSDGHRKLVRSVEVEVPWEEGDSKLL